MFNRPLLLLVSTLPPQRLLLFFFFCRLFCGPCWSQAFHLMSEIQSRVWEQLCRSGGNLTRFGGPVRAATVTPTVCVHFLLRFSRSLCTSSHVLRLLLPLLVFHHSSLCPSSSQFPNQVFHCFLLRHRLPHTLCPVCTSKHSFTVLSYSLSLPLSVATDQLCQGLFLSSFSSSSLSLVSVETRLSLRGTGGRWCVCLYASVWCPARWLPYFFRIKYLNAALLIHSRLLSMHTWEVIHETFWSLELPSRVSEVEHF